MSVADIASSLKSIATMVSIGALKKVGDLKILDPSAFEYSQLPDSYQALVMAAFNDVQENTSLLIDEMGQFVSAPKKFLESQGIRLEKVDMGSGKREYVLSHPQFDMILVN